MDTSYFSGWSNQFFKSGRIGFNCSLRKRLAVFVLAPSRRRLSSARPCVSVVMADVFLPCSSVVHSRAGTEPLLLGGAPPGSPPT